MMKSISVIDLYRKMQAGEHLHLLDIREPYEREICRISGSAFLPMNQATATPSEIPKGETTVIYCHHGIRSYMLIKHLQEKYGFDNLVNLDGGINEWALQVDREMSRY